MLGSMFGEKQKNNRNITKTIITLPEGLLPKDKRRCAVEMLVGSQLGLLVQMVFAHHNGRAWRIRCSAILVVPPNSLLHKMRCFTAFVLGVFHGSSSVEALFFKKGAKALIFEQKAISFSNSIVGCLPQHS